MRYYRKELQDLYTATQRGDIETLRHAIHVVEQKGLRGSALDSAFEALATLESKSGAQKTRSASFDSDPSSSSGSSFKMLGTTRTSESLKTVIVVDKVPDRGGALE